MAVYRRQASVMLCQQGGNRLAGCPLPSAMLLCALVSYAGDERGVTPLLAINESDM